MEPVGPGRQNGKNYSAFSCRRGRISTLGPRASEGLATPLPGRPPFPPTLRCRSSPAEDVLICAMSGHVWLASVPALVQFQQAKPSHTGGHHREAFSGRCSSCTWRSQQDTAEAQHLRSLAQRDEGVRTDAQDVRKASALFCAKCS